MKKLLTGMVSLALIVAALVGVNAGETDDEFVSNMDADTYLESRLEVIDQALADGKITQDQADDLVAHVEEVAETGAYGRGVRGDYDLAGNDDCVLGEEGQLGLFRQAEKGLGQGQGQGNRGANRGGNRGAGNGTGVCVLDAE